MMYFFFGRPWLQGLETLGAILRNLHKPRIRGGDGERQVPGARGGEPGVRLCGRRKCRPGCHVDARCCSLGVAVSRWTCYSSGRLLAYISDEAHDTQQQKYIADHIEDA